MSKAENNTKRAGVAENMSDLDIIKEIEEELGVELKKLEKLEWHSRGYVLDSGGRVTALGLYRCAIKNIERIITPVSALVNLTQLDLSYTQVSDVSRLAALVNLTQLDLRYTQISDVSPLATLVNLTQLDLRYTQISDISPLATLENLAQLDLSRNQVSDVSPLGALENLTQLDLSFTQSSDVSLLGALENLTQLNLNYTQVSDVSPLGALENLTRLNLNYTQVSDVSPLGALENLTQLTLANTQVSDVFPLGTLKNLTQLDLSSTQISNISSLGALENLTQFYLNKTPLKNLPEWITKYNIAIYWEEENYFKSGIYFYDNPLKNPPPEIIKQGKEAIKNYFNQLKEQKQDYLFEAKLLIVGEGGAGKTIMACKLENVECILPDEDDTTRGIDVKEYYFPLTKEDFKSFEHPEKLENQSFRLNIWDFGGQEIYKATHRFFLSNRSLYALVADSRNENTDFIYWLNIVEMFGGESPLLIVLNEKNQRKRNIDISAMRQRFINVKDICEVDFAETDKKRLNQLEQAVKYYVSQLPQIGSPVPAKWKTVRNALEDTPDNTISLQDYLTICRENGISKIEDARVLSQYFHDIGVFLHFQDDDLLDKTLFLKPNWATNAVYKILDHPLLNEQGGRFNRKDAEKIWSEEEEYSLIRGELLQLMQKFYLAYPIPNPNGLPNAYIVPERLPSARPDYSWNKTDNLKLQYEYDLFMPKGILSQFIVQMHPYITNHDFVWLRGVVLERENTFAEITETYDARQINIRVSGAHKRDFMTLISEQLDRINGQYEKMKWDKKIPCNCAECKNDENPHFYDYKDLKRRIERNRKEVECGKSYTMVNVRSLIDEVIDDVHTRRIDRQMIKHDELMEDEMDEKRLPAEKTQNPNNEHQVYFEKVENLYYQSSDHRAEQMENKTGNTPKIKSSWGNGSFFLFAFLSIGALYKFIADDLPIQTLALIILGSILAVPTIGAFQLMNDEKIKEENFLKLMGMVFEQLPLIGKLIEMVGKLTGKEKKIDSKSNP